MRILDLWDRSICYTRLAAIMQYIGVCVECDTTLTEPRAEQSPTLARPAAPLAACVQRISSVDNNYKTTKLGCQGNVPRGIDKLTSD